jgi:hypothetical protein
VSLAKDEQAIGTNISCSTYFALMFAAEARPWAKANLCGERVSGLLGSICLEKPSLPLVLRRSWEMDFHPDSSTGPPL